MPSMNAQINLAMCGPAGEHDHVYEPTFRLSRLAGTPHRRCTIEGCNFIALDSDECDCADLEHCSSCHAWAEKELESGFSPWSGEYIKPGETVEPLPPKWY